MIVDATRAIAVAMPDSDVLIVGSGPVGLTLARALHDRGMRTLVLEAGPRETSEPREGICDVVQDGDFLASIAKARTRQVGGGLNLWGGQLGLMEPNDVNPRNGWPLQYSEVYGHLDEVLNLVGLKGRGVAERLRSTFSQTPYLAQSGAENVRLVETAWMPFPKFNRKFWQWLEAAQTCHLLHGVTCVGLGSGGTSFSNQVQCVIGGSKPHLTVANARIVVLAAGALENARLLMLPTRGVGSQPWQRNPWLGRGFNDHLDASVGKLRVQNRSRLAQAFDPYIRNGVKYVPKIVWNDRNLTTTGLGVCGLPSYSLTAGQMLHHVSLLIKNLAHQPSAGSVIQLPNAVLTSARNMLPLVARFLTSRRIGRPGNGHVTFRVSVEQKARWESSVRLSDRERDRSGMPRCVLSWRRGDAELCAIGEFAEAVDQWLDKNRMGRIEIDETLTARSPAFWDRVDSGLHHSGTTRIGRDDREGVVDPHLCVYGARGLYVCGTSTFPSSGYINPTLTAMALAVRLADHLASNR
jgi:choline dehydrogenase-like flavoprotein